MSNFQNHPGKIRATFLAIFISTAFSSCSDNSSKNEDLFIAFYESMEASNRILTVNNNEIYQSSENKLSDPATRSFAEKWHPKITLIKNLSDTVSNFIEEIKKELIRNNAYKISKEKSKELYKKLKDVKADLLNIDPGLARNFTDNFTLIARVFDSTENNAKAFHAGFLSNKSQKANLAMLSKIQNNLKVIENRMLHFCLEQRTSHLLIDYFTTSIVGQSSKNVKGGEVIEISAGIGSFTRANNPLIIINSDTVLPGENAVAIYKLKAPKKLGTYFVPVKLEYTEFDGKKATQELTVEYTVMKNCY